MTEKYYQIGTHTSEQFYEIHDLLCADSTEEHIPDRACACFDDKPHSPTRGTFLLTDEEAAMLKNDPRIKWVNLDWSLTPEIQPPADELTNVPVTKFNRWNDTPKHYRDFENNNTLPPQITLPLPNDQINRSGYQLLRMQQYADPWQGNDATIIESDVEQLGSGKNVDVIVGDTGTWFGHPEFQNNCSRSSAPTDYVGGNVLPGDGTCDVLDLVLDSPYYLDPEWFDADPDNRLTERWDGTIVPDETAARSWWSSTSNRSSTYNAAYPTAGTVVITSFYTRSRNNGDNTTKNTNNPHGTPCAALTFGRTQGWAYNANKWAFNFYDTYGSGIEQGWDIQKIFHLTKPVNPTYGTQDPTISSNSWGFRSSSKGGDFYTFRGTTVAYGGTGAEPDFIRHMGNTGDGGRWKSEHKPSSLTTAQDEMVEAGVICVVAAGNSNQKQVRSDHPDYNNYIHDVGEALEDTTFFEQAGAEVYGTTNRRGYPQQGGKFEENGQVVYPCINVGALDDDYETFPIVKERKVNYSDRGNDIDLYAPADGTLAANQNYTNEGVYPDNYPGFTFNSGYAYDCAFGGTSAACPVACGFLATLLEHNRNWTWRDVKNYLGTLDAQSTDNFYTGSETTAAESSNWFDYESLEGGSPLVLYQGVLENTNDDSIQARISGNISLKNGLILRRR